MRRGLRLTVFIVTLLSTPGCVVYDAAVTARNQVTARVQQLMVEVQRTQRQRLRAMARRLGLLTPLDKFVLPESPQWRTHGGENYVYANPYNDALIFGDPAGAAYRALSEPLTMLDQWPAGLTAAASQAMRARLATIEAADATTIAATNDTGTVRLAGRKRERPTIDVLEGVVLDPSNDQSATAVLDKLSGAILIGARQRQARVQLLTGVVEELLIDNKRARDSEAASLNMQLVNWRDGRASNDAFVAGTGDALRTWRQP